MSTSEQQNGATPPKDFNELLTAFKAFQDRVVAEIQKRDAGANAAPLEPPHRAASPTGWDRFNQITTSGLFFMLVGGIFLVTAALTMNAQHAAFTFVLVVVGVAVLLFGTGTQGVGHAEATGYKVAIAGGAGIIAFCVGWGIVNYADDIKSVFQVERKYVRVTLEGIPGANHMNSYAGLPTINGMAIPVVRHGDSIEFFIPYTAHDWIKGDRVKDDIFVEAKDPSFKRCGSGAEKADRQQPNSNGEHKNDEYIVKSLRAEMIRLGENRELRRQFADTLTIRLRKSVIRAVSSGAEFPVYAERVCVDFVNTERMQDATTKESDRASPSKKQDQAPPADGPAPILPPDV